MEQRPRQRWIWVRHEFLVGVLLLRRGLMSLISLLYVPHVHNYILQSYFLSAYLQSADYLEIDMCVEPERSRPDCTQ